MQVTLEETSELERRIIISVPSREVDDRVNEELLKTRSKVRLNGFRPGKVPLREVRRRFGTEVRREVTDELIQKSFSDALEETELTPAGAPDIRDVQSETGQDLQFTAEFEIYPDVGLKDFSSLQVTRPLAGITEADIDEMVEQLRQQRKTYRAVEREAEAGDQLTVDFAGSVDGEAFSGGEAENFSLVLGTGQMIDGFESQLEGLSAGTGTSIQVTFPETYQVAQVAGKDAVFAVKVHQVAEPCLPEVNDDFYVAFGVTEGGEEAFRAEVKRNMQREVDGVVRNRIRDEAMQALSGAYELTLPKGLVKLELQRTQAELMRRIGADPRQGMALPPPDSPLVAEAERKVKLGLIVREIIRSRDMQADASAIRARIDTIASTYEEPEQVVNWFYSNEEQLEQISNSVLEEAVVNLVVEECQVTDQEIGYQELMQPPAQETGDSTATTPEEAVAAGDFADADREADPPAS